MKLKDLPWRPFGGSGRPTDEVALVFADDNRTIVVWRPGSGGCEVELLVQGGQHEYLTALEARSRLLALGARLPDKVTP